MSDYTRTTLVWPVVAKQTSVVVDALAQYFESQGKFPLISDPTLPLAARAAFCPIADTAEKFRQPEWLERVDPSPSDNPSLVKRAEAYPDLAIHSTFPIGGSGYQGTLLVYDVAYPNGECKERNSFVRLSFHSYLIYDLRGTRDFGGPTNINEKMKTAMTSMAVGLSKAIGAEGFVFGLEGDDEPLPFSADQVTDFLRDPRQAPPVPPFLVGIKAALVSADELIRVWLEESAIRRSDLEFVILDLLKE